MVYIVRGEEYGAECGEAGKLRHRVIVIKLTVMLLLLSMHWHRYIYNYSYFTQTKRTDVSCWSVCCWSTINEFYYDTMKQNVICLLNVSIINSVYYTYSVVEIHSSLAYIGLTKHSQNTILQNCSAKTIYEGIITNSKVWMVY